MNSFTRAVLVIALLIATCGAARARGFEADFDAFWNQVRSDYPYFATKATDWSCVRDTYRPQAAATEDRAQFIRILERAIDELYDPHASLNTNLPSSTRLVPSGLDVWAEWREGQAIITQLRPDAAAGRAGLRAGMQVISVNGVAIDKAVAARLGRCLRRPEPRARDWALLAVLAGQHDTPRDIEVRVGSATTVFHPDAHPVEAPDQPGATFRLLDDNLGYIAIHDIGADETVSLFEAALEQLRNTRGLLLDLRDTAAGGSTAVAEPIMGRLISHRHAYQLVQPPHRHAWQAIASPRGPWAYKAPVVVLVSRWTGSMGEGTAIGLDGMHRARVVGTRMAGLNGAVFTHHLPQSGINYSFPGEALAHIDGSPRENFVPPVLVDMSAAGQPDAQDLVLQAGIRELTSTIAP